MFLVMVDNYGSIAFLWIYMFIIWGTLINAWRKRPRKNGKLTSQPPIWKNLFLAFLLLAIGDVFHLTPRTYLWYLYQFENNTEIYQSPLGIQIYAFGLIFTGITMTFFYLFLYFFWKETYRDIETPFFQNLKRKEKTMDIIFYSALIVRIILILLPWNAWGSEPTYVYTVFSFRTLTNLPLYVIGILIIYLFWTSPRHAKGSTEDVSPSINHAVKQSAYWIIVSYATYTCTIFGVPINPLWGMMMIPKTIAYLIVLYYINKDILTNNDLLISK